MPESEESDTNEHESKVFKGMTENAIYCLCELNNDCNYIFILISFTFLDAFDMLGRVYFFIAIPQNTMTTIPDKLSRVFLYKERYRGKFYLSN